MPDIPLRSQCFDLTFSPLSNTLYVGLLSGYVKALIYAEDGSAEEAWSLRPSKYSCRGLATSEDGRRLFGVSKDRCLRVIDPGTGEILDERLGAHDSAISRIVPCTEWTLATGDDDGVIKLWDTRKPLATHTYTHHIDYISDLIYSEAQHQVIATSGDCTLSIMDTRSNSLKPVAHSADQDDEYLSVALSSHSSRLVVGTQTGILTIYDQPASSSPSPSLLFPIDRMPGHPSSVDTLLALSLPNVPDDTIIATGSSDGLVRLVQILPNKLLGAVADHGTYPVERLALSRDGRWLASASHEEGIKMTDIADALVDSDDEEGHDDAEEEDVDGDEEIKVDDAQLDEAEADDEPLPRALKRQMEVDSSGDEVEPDRDPVEPTVLKASRSRKKRKGEHQPPSISSSFFAGL